MTESPILLHIWAVSPDEQADLIERLERLFRELRSDPGFVSARILETADHDSVAAIVEMRSVEDRQRIEVRADVRDALDNVHEAFNLLYRLYHEIETVA